MHGNLRYVKSQWIGLTAALVLVSPAQAEVMTDRAVGAFQASGLNSRQGDLCRAVELAAGIPFDFLSGVPVGVSG